MNQKTAFSAAALFLVVLAAAPSALAAGKDELWEVTRKMAGVSEMPEMPEGVPAGMMPQGMGGMGKPVQVCRSSDPEDEIKRSKDMKDCKLTDKKASGSRMTMKVSCKGGRTMVMEYKFNADRTAYTGTMRMDKGGGEEMTMQTSGRKIGTCDAKAARAEQTAQVEKLRARSDAAQAQGKASYKNAIDSQLAQCVKAVEVMDASGFGMNGSCRGEAASSCLSYQKGMNQSQPELVTGCKAKADEFCRRLKTIEGYQKAGANNYRLKQAAEYCGVDAGSVAESLCPKALKSENWPFLGSFCPKQAKPLVQAHCAGRSYTAKKGDPRRVEDKWHNFCTAIAGSAAMGEGEMEAAVEAPKSTRRSARDDAESAAGDAIKQEGLNKLKGLFGR